MMTIYRRITALLLCALAAATLLSVSALAAGSIDLDKDASLTITEKFGDDALSGVEVDIYLVSTADSTGELTPLEPFRKFASSLDIRGKDDEAWQSMAETLEREIILGGIDVTSPTDSAVTDETGTARFPSNGKRLEKGLYLVMGTGIQKGGYVYFTSPYFVMIPEQDLESNTWNYTVTVKAKPGQSPVLADFEVIKIWKDDCHKDRRPQSISIQLMQDGNPYGDPVTLPYNGAWKYTWHDLDVNHKWTVEEQKVEGYKEPEVRQEGNTFIVTNTCSTPDPSPSNPSLPQTGQLWWPVPVLTAAGLLLLVIGLVRRRGANNEK